MGVAFVPIYIRFLGIEAYGLIGAFAVLYSLLVIFDLGLTPTLTREISRFCGGASSPTEIRDLIRSAEFIAGAVAFLVALSFWLMADFLASSWFKVEQLNLETVAHAVTAMGLVAALRFAESIYRGCVTGLQQLVLLGSFNAVGATVRALGAIIVLAWVSNTIEAFFLWQALISAISLTILAVVTYRSLPKGDREARPSMAAVQRVSRFASGMVAVSILSIGLTQLDKLLLSKLLSLSEFGRYSLASLVAVSLEMLAVPAFQAFSPRFAQLQAVGDVRQFAELYHKGAQLVSITAGPAAIVLIFYAETFLALWTQDPTLAGSTAPILQVLALGYLLNLTMWMPYLAQLAHGWTSLTIRTNVLALLVIGPLLYWLVPRYGAVGAAWVWTGLNATYVLVTVQFVHRRILKGEKCAWYVKDVLTPALAAAVATLVVSWALPPDQFDELGQLIAIVVAGASAVAASIASAPVYRTIVIEWVGNVWARV